MMVARFIRVRFGLVAMTTAAAVLLTARPSFAACSSILGSPGVFCSDTSPDHGYINATARVGAASGSFDDGEIQIYFDGEWHFYDAATTAHSLGAGSFDCPDGGTVESWGVRYDYYRQSDLLLDTKSYNVKMMCTISGTPVPSNTVSNFTFNCP